MKFSCPRCTQSLEADESQAGITFNCPTCQYPLTVPKLAVSAPASVTKPLSPPSSPSIVGAVVVALVLIVSFAAWMATYSSFRGSAHKVRGSKATEIKAKSELDAPGYLAKAKAKVHAVESSGDQNQALHALAIVQAEAGNFAAAQESIDAIADNPLKASTLVAVSYQQAKAGNTEESQQSLAKAKAIVNSVFSVKEKIDVLLSIAVEQCKEGNLSAGRQAIAEAKGMTNASMVSGQAKNLLNIVLVQAKVGEVHEAFETYRQLYGTGSVEETDALSAITAAQVRTGNMGSAQSNANGDSFAMGAMLTAVADRQAEEGNIVSAKATANSIERAQYRAMAFLDIARIQARKGDVEGAQKTQQECISQGASIPRSLYSKTRAVIAVGQAVSGDVLNASEMAMGIGRDDSLYQAKAQALIASAEAKKEGFHSAEEWVKQFRNPLDETLCYIALAERKLNKDGASVLTVEE